MKYRDAVIRVIIGSTLVLMSGLALGQPYHLESTGWSGETIGGQTRGTGSFGNFSAQSFFQIDPTPVDVCQRDPVTGAPQALLLRYLDVVAVLRSANGDLLYRKLNDAQDSFVCLNFIEQQARAEILLDVIGGTGRFEGASGTATQVLEVELLGGLNGVRVREDGYLD